jgi:hypothetical protein
LTPILSRILLERCRRKQYAVTVSFDSFLVPGHFSLRRHKPGRCVLVAGALRCYPFRILSSCRAADRSASARVIISSFCSVNRHDPRSACMIMRPHELILSDLVL